VIPSFALKLEVEKRVALKVLDSLASTGKSEPEKKKKKRKTRKRKKENKEEEEEEEENGSADEVPSASSDDEEESVVSDCPISEADEKARKAAREREIRLFKRNSFNLDYNNEHDVLRVNIPGTLSRSDRAGLAALASLGKINPIKSGYDMEETNLKLLEREAKEERSSEFSRGNRAGLAGLAAPALGRLGIQPSYEEPKFELEIERRIASGFYLFNSI